MAIADVQASDGAWQLLLRCGGCGQWRQSVLPQIIAEAFAQHIEAELTAITREIKRRDAEHIEAEIDRFAAALREGSIDAGDFL